MCLVNNIFDVAQRPILGTWFGNFDDDNIEHSNDQNKYPIRRVNDEFPLQHSATFCTPGTTCSAPDALGPGKPILQSDHLSKATNAGDLTFLRPSAEKCEITCIDGLGQVVRL